jgi:hypothetical protein
VHELPVFWIGAVALVGAVGLGIWWFSREQRIKRALRQLRATRG